jgi:hypothetical protein
MRWRTVAPSHGCSGDPDGRKGRSANENRCARISMMARSCAPRGPDTLAQDQPHHLEFPCDARPVHTSGSLAEPPHLGNEASRSGPSRLSSLERSGPSGSGPSCPRSSRPCLVQPGRRQQAASPRPDCAPGRRCVSQWAGAITSHCHAAEDGPARSVRDHGADPRRRGAAGWRGRICTGASRCFQVGLIGEGL